MFQKDVMWSLGINAEGELKGELANPGSPGEMAVKVEYVCACVRNMGLW